MAKKKKGKKRNHGSRIFDFDPLTPDLLTSDLTFKGTTMKQCAFRGVKYSMIKYSTSVPELPSH